MFILKLEGLLQVYVKWKNTMTGNVNFLTQNVGPWTCYKQIIWGYWLKQYWFCALSVIFLRLVCILKLEGLLQVYVKWKNTMTGNVNFLTQNVGPCTCYKQFIRGYCPKQYWFCALSVIFLRLVCILKLEGLLQGYVKWKKQWRVMSTFWHKMSGLGLVISNL